MQALPATLCHLDGEYLPLRDAKISVLDRGFIFGDGIYEVIPAYDGHHIAVYLANFSRPYQGLVERGLVSMETNDSEYRFIDIVDLDSGAVLTQLEHEVRSMHHPLFGRELVNRNPVQRIFAYNPGEDAFRGLTHAGLG